MSNIKDSRRRVAWTACCGWTLLLVAGCMRSEPPRFRLDLQGPDRQAATRAQEQLLVDALYAVFGSPDEPYDLNHFVASGLDLQKLQLAAGPAARTGASKGQKHGLYREHCAHCHGISGDGAGPTAVFLNPYPRDYRKGIFKFTSTAQGRRPTQEDLKRTLREGIPGTAMPSFALLPEDEIDALVEYVRYLAIRGEAESYLYSMVVDDEATEITADQLRDEVLTPVLENWINPDLLKVIEPAPPSFFQADKDHDGKLGREEAAGRLAESFARFDANQDGQVDDREILALDANGNKQIDDDELLSSQAWPDPAINTAADKDGDGKVSQAEAETWLAAWFERADADGDGSMDAQERLAASIASGQRLFQNAERAKCSSCHGPTALGDGGQASYDVWNDPKKELTPAEVARLWTLPIQQLKPRNLRQGTYRGGRRPLDLYRRMYAGVKGTPMAAQGPNAGNRGSLSPDEIWDLVDYIRTLPYEESSQPYHQVAVGRELPN